MVETLFYDKPHEKNMKNLQTKLYLALFSDFEYLVPLQSNEIFFHVSSEKTYCRKAIFKNIFLYVRIITKDQSSHIILCHVMSSLHIKNKAGYTANPQSLLVGRGSDASGQGQYMSGSGDGQKSVFQSISRHQNFRVPDGHSDRQTDIQTFRPRDTPSYRVARQRLKRS